MAHTAEVGAYLLAQLKAAFGGRPYTVDVRGRGLMCGVQIKGDPRLVIDAARDRGLLLSVAGADVLRMTPPLIVTKADVDTAVEALLAAAEATVGSTAG